MIRTKELKTEIRKSGYKFNYIAVKVGLSAYGLRKKVDGETEFKVSEVNRLSKILNLTEKKRNFIFCL